MKMDCLPHESVNAYLNWMAKVCHRRDFVASDKRVLAGVVETVLMNEAEPDRGERGFDATNQKEETTPPLRGSR